MEVKFPNLLRIAVLLIFTSFSCDPTFKKPKDPDPEPALRDVVIEYDNMWGFDVTSDFTFTPTYNEYEATVRKLFLKPEGDKSPQLNIIGITSDDSLPDGNLSTASPSLNIIYAQQYREPFGFGKLYKYHLVAVNTFDVNPNGASGWTYSFGTINVPVNDPAQRVSFILVEDSRNFCTANSIDRKQFFAYTTAHELGHQVNGLTHAFDQTAQYHDTNDKCIMDYYTVSEIQQQALSNVRFCYDPNTTSKPTCTYYLRHALIDKPDVAYSD